MGEVAFIVALLFVAAVVIALVARTYELAEKNRRLERALHELMRREAGRE